jgi:hypothetical protein
MLAGRIGKKALETSHGVFLYVGQHVGVDVHGDVYARVAEDLLEDLDGFSGLEPEGGEGVAQGVEGRICREVRLLGERQYRCGGAACSGPRSPGWRPHPPPASRPGPRSPTQRPRPSSPDAPSPLGDHRPPSALPSLIPTSRPPGLPTRLSIQRTQAPFQIGSSPINALARDDAADTPFRIHNIAPAARDQVEVAMGRSSVRRLRLRSRRR